MRNVETLTGKGSYILWFWNRKQKIFEPGKLGTFLLQRGWYAYCGSALGSGGLKARLGRHLRKEKKIHWHIDHLTALLPIREIWYISSTFRYEHLFTKRLLMQKESNKPIRGFGSSDCNECESHLVYLRRKPEMIILQSEIIRHQPDDRLEKFRI